MSNETISGFYPGIEKIGWISRTKLNPIKLVLTQTGLCMYSISDTTVNWLDCLTIPILKSTLLIKSSGHTCQCELEFKVSEIDIPSDSLFIAVDAQGTAYLVGGISPHYGEYDVKKQTSTPSGDAPCYNVKYSANCTPRRILLY